MKIIVYGDTHIHDIKEFYRLTDKGYSNRIDLMIKSLEFVFDYAIKHDIKYCVHLGDMYQYPKSIDTMISSLVADVYHRPLYEPLKHVYVTGNHDVIDDNQKYSVMAKMKKTFEVIVDRSNYGSMHELREHWTTTPVKYLAIPYSDDTDQVMDFLERVPDKENTIVFTHLEIEKCKYDNGQVIEKGVKQELLAKFKLIANGHIHLRSIFGTKSNIVNIGSLMEHNFSDNKGEKGFMVYDTESNMFTFMDNPHSPIFETVTITSKSQLTSLKQNSPVHFYRINIDPEVLGQNTEYLDLVLNKSITPISKQHEEQVRIEVSPCMTDFDHVKSYVEFQKAEKKASLLRLGKLVVGDANE